jgi:hypothetical protein
MSVTTATVWVCSKCGLPSHLDGGSIPSSVLHGICSASSYGPHVLKPVLVVVPYA